MWIKALILGIIQGFAEFLPISSSGHLVLASELLNINAPGNVMEVMLHLGTLGSVIVCFWQKIKLLIIDFFSMFTKKRTKIYGKSAEYKNLSWYLIIASIPAVITGLLLDNYFQELFDKVIYSGIALLITAAVLWFADSFSRGRKKLKNLSAKDALLIGIWQGIAVLPGISRAGMTIFGGLKRGLKKESAVEWSFLMSIPVIAGATLLKIPALFTTTGLDIKSIVIGTIASFLSGIIAIKFLLAFIKQRGWKAFSIYCAVVGLVIIITTIF